MLTHPNLLLMGLPKCGTSTIFDQLCQHSAIEGTTPKETFYLCDPESPLCKLKKYDDWTTAFSAKNGSVQYILEGSTHTVFQETALHYFHQNITVKGLIVLRDPVKRIFSSFTFTKYNLNAIDKSITFKQYVEDLLATNDFSYISDEISRFVLSNELVHSKYEQVLKPWKDLIQQGRVKIIVFENLLENPSKVYNEIFEWLSIKPEKIWNTQAKNITLLPKNRFLHRFAIFINKKVHTWKMFMPIKNLYKKIMTIKQSPNQDDLLAMSKLKDEFKNSNRNLVVQFGVNTSYWE